MTAPSTSPKILLRDVAKTFGAGRDEFAALGGFSLAVDDGEFVTVVGPSGCGKSTVLAILAGLEPATSGSVAVDGAPVSGPGPERGVVFQQYALFPWLTVRQNVEFGIRDLPRHERRKRSDHFIDLVGLGAFADNLPKTLSGGMKQRCAIARAYAADPSILLMDEPFGALDSLTRARLQEQLLQTWTADRRTILFVTHDVDEAVFLANRVVVMAGRPGRVHAEVEVALPYPRTEDIRLGPDFTELRNRVWHAVHHQ